MRKATKTLVGISLFWNLFLVAGVVLNQNYALKRAAGGQFETFPLEIRIIYCFTFALVVYQTFLLFINKTPQPRWVYTALLYLSLLSSTLNGISQSNLERWNAIPAALISFAFYQKRREARA